MTRRPINENTILLEHWALNHTAQFKAFIPQLSGEICPFFLDAPNPEQLLNIITNVHVDAVYPKETPP